MLAPYILINSKMFFSLSPHLSWGFLQTLIYKHMNSFSHCKNGLMQKLNLNEMWQLCSEQYTDYIIRPTSSPISGFNVCFIRDI